jgi:hypothetical protein
MVKGSCGTTLTPAFRLGVQQHANRRAYTVFISSHDLSRHRQAPTTGPDRAASIFMLYIRSLV